MNASEPSDNLQTSQSSNYISHRGTSDSRSKLPADHVGLLIASGMMLLAGWGGLYWLITQSIPRVGQRWLFFFLLQITVTGTVLPAIRYLNLRFTPINHEIPSGMIIVRQSMWVALFTVTCAWLQIPRVLTWSMAFFLAIVFMILEFFLRLRERQLESMEKEWE